MKHSLPCRALRKRPMKLGTTVILMVSAVLFSVLVVVHLIYFSQISSMTRDALADKALAVARSLADSPAIREGLKKPPAESGIQPLAEAVSQHNGFLFIVVTNMQGIRYSHPETQRYYLVHSVRRSGGVIRHVCAGQGAKTYPVWPRTL